MSLTVPQYVEAMRERQEVLARRLGVDLRGAPMEIRVAMTCVNAMVAINFLALNKLGLVTDAQLSEAFDDAMSQAFPAELPIGPNADPDPGTA